MQIVLMCLDIKFQLTEVLLPMSEYAIDKIFIYTTLGKFSYLRAKSSEGLERVEAVNEA